jgi:hypothetical protein
VISPVQDARCLTYPGGLCDVLLRADDIVHDDVASEAQILQTRFAGPEFCTALKIEDGLKSPGGPCAVTPRPALGRWIGNHALHWTVVTFRAKQMRLRASSCPGLDRLPVKDGPEGYSISSRSADHHAGFDLRANAPTKQ